MRNASAFPFLDQALGRRLTAVGVAWTDVEEHFIRGSGPGGQKINKTSSTVQLRHRPTGIIVRSQRERSQSDNRTEAWEELANRLEERRRAAAAALREAREAERRRTRPKSRAQKARMVEGKRRQAKRKSQRGPVSWD